MIFELHGAVNKLRFPLLWVSWGSGERRPKKKKKKIYSMLDGNVLYKTKLREIGSARRALSSFEVAF